MRNELLLAVCFSILASCGEVDNQEPLDTKDAQGLDAMVGPTLAGGGALEASSRFEAPRRWSDSIVIGLDADMSSAGSQAGEAIRRGIELALVGINADGGLLGHKVELVTRDHRGNPARGIDNLVEFSTMENLVAVVGGMHTPVALEELPMIHENEIVYLDPWAAGTPVVENGYEPNYVFRVSVRDEYAGEFLIQQALELGYQRPGLLLEETGWGRSNHVALTRALQLKGGSVADVQWFHWGESELDSKILSLSDAGADVVLFVGNPLEGAQCVKAMAAVEVPDRLPILSHWGITGCPFHELSGSSLQKVDLSFLQTFSFIEPPLPERAQAVIASYYELFDGAASPRDIFSPVGTAHAFDLTRMLAIAIKAAKSLERSRIREALESLEFFEGLIRDYSPPFEIGDHDALDIEDYRLARYDSVGVIVPAATTSLKR